MTMSVKRPLLPIIMRVGNYPSLEEKFWLVHGIIKTHPLIQGIHQVWTTVFFNENFVRIFFLFFLAKFLKSFFLKILPKSLSFEILRYVLDTLCKRGTERQKQKTYHVP